MTHRLAALTLAVLLAPPASWAQLAAPNRTGVAMGHLHYRVRDVEANARFWVALGGTPIKVGDTDAVKFPGVLVLLGEGESSGGSDGSVVNHVAFRVLSLAEIEAKGFTVQRLPRFPGVASVHTPEGERIELFDNTAENLSFQTDDGLVDPIAERHNRRLEVPIAAHHVHLYLPQGAELEAKAWYGRLFGATPGKRSNYQAVDLPGINLNFSENPGERAPTRGRMLDHIGFEVANLEAFCRRLAAGGVRFDEPYRRDALGIGRARLTDPWGTSIELTEGLSGL
ncbi:MAG: VOC family protein [Gemmatimonadetes bacterium]|nr:VOC family protein [Gemmatimonadota bacterium]